MLNFRYETLKHKVKSNETDDIKLIKTISLQTRENYNKSPLISNSKGRIDYDKGVLRNLQQARKDRKKAPVHTARGLKNNLEAFERKNMNKTPNRMDTRPENTLGVETDFDRKRINSNSK